MWLTTEERATLQKIVVAEDRQIEHPSVISAFRFVCCRHHIYRYIFYGHVCLFWSLRSLVLSVSFGLTVQIETVGDGREGRSAREDGAG